MPWLRHFALFLVFVTALFRPAAAGAFVSAPDANAQARVGAFDLVAATLVGPTSAAACGLHEGIGAAYDENASGYRFAAGGVGAAEREATGFLGSRGAPLANAPYQPLRNADAVIGGRTFGGHALDQMQNRGLMPSVVENAIQTGVRSPDPIVGRFRFFDAVNKVTVITEGERVVTVIPGRLR